MSTSRSQTLLGCWKLRKGFSQWFSHVLLLSSLRKFLSIPSSVRHWTWNHMSLLVLSFYFKWDSKVENYKIYKFIVLIPSFVFFFFLAGLDPTSLECVRSGIVSVSPGEVEKGSSGLFSWHPALTRAGFILLQSSGLCCYFSALPQRCGRIQGFYKAAQTLCSEVLE